MSGARLPTGLRGMPSEIACKNGVRLDAVGPMFAFRPSYRGLLRKHCALPISQCAYVLEMGRIGLERSSLDLLNDDKVKQFYLGG